MILPSGSGVSVVLALVALAAYAVPAIAASRVNESAARGLLVAGWVLHALSLVWGFLEPSPQFGWAKALSVTVWFVVTVFVFESRVFPPARMRWALLALAAVALLPPIAFPGEPLRAEAPMAPMHWTFGLAAYGLFAAAVVHALLMRRAESAIREGGEPYTGVPLLMLERLTFNFALAGFIVLSVTILAGFLFTHWRWNHENVFSILAWVVFAYLLLGRFRFGWRGRKAVRVLYTGSILLLLGYAGSRFVLEVILRRTP
ncbi:MAG TPA: cytochrome c biogenesis protein CcsA [Ramlibacter sp.]|nr:cytochrome c biogenesis protein CcsA [Ramlibacter sp.]